MQKLYMHIPISFLFYFSNYICTFQHWALWTTQFKLRATNSQFYKRNKKSQMNTLSLTKIAIHNPSREKENKNRTTASRKNFQAPGWERIPTPIAPALTHCISRSRTHTYCGLALYVCMKSVKAPKLLRWSKLRFSSIDGRSPWLISST